MLAKTTTYKLRYWLKYVEASDLSDGTITEYATSHDISLKGLYQWKTKLMKLKLFQPAPLSPGPDFAPVKPSPSTMHKQVYQTEQSGCTVALTNVLEPICY